MNRNDFNKTLFIYTLVLTLTPSLISCSLNSNKAKKNSVLIIGAGAAGIYAGYLLNKLNIDFKILEASSIHGGRVGKIIGFADYNIESCMIDKVMKENSDLDDSNFKTYFSQYFDHINSNIDEKYLYLTN